MLKLFKVRVPGRRAIISIVLVLALSYSAFIVGDAMRPESNDEGGETNVHYDTVGLSVTTSANAPSMAAADAAVAAVATSARSASSGFSLPNLFNVEAEVDDLAFEVVDIEDLTGRMVVYSAYLGLKVDDIDASLDQIKLISVMHSGYISEVNTRDERGSVSLRIPQSKFHGALTDLEEVGEVTTRDMMGEDVTEEYVDLEAQLVTLQHQESRLFEIMEMGTTVDSVLKVERELERVRGRIESIQGRIKFLDNRVELSTITVSLREEIKEVEVIQAWFPAVDWGVPVRNGLSVLFTMAQGMLTMVIVLGPFIALGYSGVRLFRWYRSGRLVPVEDEESLV